VPALIEVVSLGFIALKCNVESAQKKKTYPSVAGISEGMSESCALISGAVE
jgi:hypothetical protein